MTIPTPLHAEHQLDQVAGQFAHWRQTRPHPHSPIPPELWATRWRVSFRSACLLFRRGFPEYLVA